MVIIINIMKCPDDIIGKSYTVFIFCNIMTVAHIGYTKIKKNQHSYNHT